MPGRQGETKPHVLLVAGMNLGLADIHRHGHAGIRQGKGPELRLPKEMNATGFPRAIGQLHEEEGEVASWHAGMSAVAILRRPGAWRRRLTPALTPAGDQRGKQGAVQDGQIAVGFTLVPDNTFDREGHQRGDHAIVQHRGIIPPAGTAFILVGLGLFQLGLGWQRFALGLGLLHLGSPLLAGLVIGLAALFEPLLVLCLPSGEVFLVVVLLDPHAIGPDLFEIVDILLEALVGAERFQTGPGLGRRAAAIGADQPDGHAQGLVQLPAEKVSHARKARHRLGRANDPLAFTVALRLEGNFKANLEQTNPGMIELGYLRGTEGGRKRPGHVRLPGANPDLAHEDVVKRET